MNIEQARFNMIEQQIRPWDVLDPQVLDLLFVIKRENFTPPAYRSLAFADMELPLGDGQSMLTPKVEAKLLQELGLRKTDKVLEIGTGSGYMAALLAARAEHVVTVECRPALAELARQNLAEAGVANVTVETGNGAGRLALARPLRCNRRFRLAADAARRPAQAIACRWPPGCHRRRSASHGSRTGDLYRRRHLQQRQPVRDGHRPA
jgi:protein-L-isoaspartate(D-aspartate) O-methyltransferase